MHPGKQFIIIFPAGKRRGIFEIIHEELVEKVRVIKGRKEEPTVGIKEEPTVGIIDAQSVKNTLVSSEVKGFGAGKKIKGIKRHIIVDTLGLILAVVIQSASVQDRDGAIDIVSRLCESWKKVVRIFADGSCTGQLIDIIKAKFKIELEIIKKDDLHTFKILPKRWIVKRTFSWVDTNRRNSKNYERLTNTSVAMVHL